jgi:hypothetical protein
MDLDHYYATRIARERTNHQPTSPAGTPTRQHQPMGARLRAALRAIHLPTTPRHSAPTPAR